MLCLTACQTSDYQKNEEAVTFNADDFYYFAYTDDTVRKGTENQFLFLDEKGELIKMETDVMKSKKDIFYYELNKDKKILYMFGNGGMVSIDFKNGEVKRLSDKNINAIGFYNERLFYYENGGFSEQKYNAKICEFEGNCNQLDYPVGKMLIHNDKLYVIYGYKDNNFFAIIDVLDKNLPYVEQELVENAYSLFIYNDVVYLTGGHGIISELEPDKILFYRDINGNQLEMPAKVFVNSENEIVLFDEMNRSFYKVTLENDDALCEKMLDLERGVEVYPSMNDDELTLRNTNYDIKTLNLVTGEITDQVTINHERIYHVIKVK